MVFTICGTKSNAKEKKNSRSPISINTRPKMALRYYQRRQHFIPRLIRYLQFGQSKISVSLNDIITLIATTAP